MTRIYQHHKKKKKKHEKTWSITRFFLLIKRNRKNGLKRDKIEIDNTEMRVIK